MPPFYGGPRQLPPLLSHKSGPAESIYDCVLHNDKHLLEPRLTETEQIFKKFNCPTANNTLYNLIAFILKRGYDVKLYHWRKSWGVHPPPPPPPHTHTHF